MNYAEARLSLGCDHRMQQLEIDEELYHMIENMLHTMSRYSNQKQQEQINYIRCELQNLHREYEEEYMYHHRRIVELIEIKEKEKQ